MAHDLPVSFRPLCYVDLALTVDSHCDAKFNSGCVKCRVYHLIWRVGLDWRMWLTIVAGFGAKVGAKTEGPPPWGMEHLRPARLR